MAGAGWRGTTAATRFLIASSVLAAAVVGVEWFRLPVPDVSWLLYVTERVTGGAKYGVDIVDVAPPTIIWFSRPAIWLSSVLGITSWRAFIIELLLLTAATGGMVVAIARRLPGLGTEALRLILAAMAVALLALPMELIGEREHVALLLVTPYVLLFAAREEAAVIPTFLALWAGALAGFGFAIKPYFGLPWALLILVAWRRGRGIDLRRRPEILAGALAAAACVGAVLGLEPGYVAYLREFGTLYFGYMPQDPVFVAFVGEGNWALAVLFALGAALALRNSLNPPARPLVLYLATAAAGFHMVASGQLKGWRYHYLPGLGLSLILLVVMLEATRWRGLRPVGVAYRAGAIGAITLLVSGTLIAVSGRLSGSVSATFDSDYEQLLKAVQEHDGGEAIAVLSSNLASAFPLVGTANRPWALRYGGLPWLAAFYPDEIRAGRIVTPTAFPARGPLERHFGETVVADLQARSPGLIILPTPMAGASHYRLFDYLQYFESVPGFTRFFAQYSLEREVDAYQVFTKIPGRPELKGSPWSR